MRWHRLVRQARDAVRSGELGEIRTIRCLWNSPRGDDGTPDWKLHRADGGGALMELGVHMFDLWRYLLDTEAEEVFARTACGVRDDEQATVTARLSNGVLATADLSERNAHAIEVEVGGTRARLRVDAQSFDGFQLYGLRETSGGTGPRLRGLQRFARELPRGLARMKSLGDYGDSYRAMWEHFCRAARGEASLECTLADGRAALQIALAAIRSATSGTPVTVASAGESLTAR